MLYDFLLMFIPLFVVIDPAGTVPLFLALTEHHSQTWRRRIARRATLVAALTGVVFLAVGQGIFALLGIRFADFQIAGGILLVVLAILDLLSTSKPAVDETKLVEADSSNLTVGVVPLAVPLIVGPATLTTGLLLVSTYSGKYSGAEYYGPQWGPVVVVAMVAAALLANLAVLFAAMWYANVLVRLVGRNTMLVVNKIVMILLAAIAVSLIRQGIESIVAELKSL